MSVKSQNMPLATSAAAAPGLLSQLGMAGTSAVITVGQMEPCSRNEVYALAVFDR